MEDLGQKRLCPLEMSQKFSRFGDSIDLEFNHPPKICAKLVMGGCLDDFLRYFAKDILKKYNSLIFCGQNNALFPPFVEMKKQQTPSTKPKKTDIRDRNI